MIILQYAENETIHNIYRGVAVSQFTSCRYSMHNNWYSCSTALKMKGLSHLWLLFNLCIVLSVDFGNDIIESSGFVTR